MRSSRNLIHAVLAFFAVLSFSSAAWAANVIGINGINYPGNNVGEITLSAVLNSVGGEPSAVEFQYRVEDGDWIPIGTDDDPDDGFSVVWNTGDIFSWTVFVRARTLPDGSWYQSEPFKSFNIMTGPITGIMSPATGSITLTASVNAPQPYVFPNPFPEGQANYTVWTAASYTAENLDTPERGNISLIRTNFQGSGTITVKFNIWPGPGAPSTTATYSSSAFAVSTGIQRFPLNISNVPAGSFVGFTVTSNNTNCYVIYYGWAAASGQPMPSYGSLYYKATTSNSWANTTYYSGPAIEYTLQNPYVAPTGVQFAYKDGANGEVHMIGDATHNADGTYSITWDSTGFGSDRTYIGSRVRTNTDWCSWSWQGPYTVVNPVTFTFTNNVGHGKVSLDDVEYDVPETKVWNYLETHTVSVPLYLDEEENSRRRFNRWNVGGNRIQTFKISMDTPVNWVAYYVRQYRYETTTPYGTIHGDFTGWYDYRTRLRTYVEQYVIVGGGDRYACTGWIATGSLSDGASNDTGYFRLTAPTTVLWQWAKQYYFDVSTPHGQVYGSTTGWYSEGATLASYVDSPVAIDDDRRWVCVGWTGTGSIGDGSVSYTGQFQITQETTVVFNWRLQYRLRVDANYGTIMPDKRWFFEGETVELSAYSPGNTAEQRFFWQGWTGTDIGGTPAGDPTMTVTMDKPRSYEAHWRAEYYLMAVAQNGALADDYDGWYPDGATVQIEALPPAPEPGVRFVVGWSGTGFTEVEPAPDAPNPIEVTLNGPVSVFATWVRQFALQIINPQGVGTPSPAPGTYWYYSGERVRGWTDFRSAGMICAGFIGTGSAPSGDEPYFEFLITEPSTVTWNWAPPEMAPAPEWTAPRDVALHAAGTLTAVKRMADGSPVIAYYSRPDHALKVAWMRDGSWSIDKVFEFPEGLEKPGNSLGLAVDGHGVPHVLFYDPTRKAVVHGLFSGSTWTVSVVDDEGDPGTFCSIAIAPGNVPCFAWYCAETGDLVFARFEGNVLQKEAVASDGNVGLYASLAVSPMDGAARIAYYDATNGDLKCAIQTESGWDVFTVDAEGDVGAGCVIGLDPAGAPMIAYQENTGAAEQGLRFAFFLDGGWQLYDLAEGEMTGFGISLAVDGRGNPHVTYHDFSGLHYARFNGLLWSTGKIFDGAATGFTAVALDDEDNPCAVFWNGDKLVYLDAEGNHFALEITPDEAAFAQAAVETAGGGGGGCFVATAAFGSMAAGAVEALTAFRDDTLYRSECSAGLVMLYYRTGCPLAGGIAGSSSLRAFVRRLLEGM